MANVQMQPQIAAAPGARSRGLLPAAAAARKRQSRRLTLGSLPAFEESDENRGASLPFSPPAEHAHKPKPRRAPLEELAQNNGALRKANGSKPTAQSKQLEGMDVWTLRQLIRTAGLTHADCDGIPALQDRAREALAARAAAPATGEESFSTQADGTARARGAKHGSGGSQRNTRPVPPSAATPAARCKHGEPSKRPSDAESSASKRARFALEHGGAGAPALEPELQRRLLESAVVDDILSAQMQYRLICCAEEAHLEVECSADDVDWEIAVNAQAAKATMLNAVYLSEFIPARVIERLSQNTSLLRQFILGYAQCFQAILYLLKSRCAKPILLPPSAHSHSAAPLARCVTQPSIPDATGCRRTLPTAARMRSCLDSGAALQGKLPEDCVPSHSVFFGAGGCAEYAIDAWLRTSEAEYDKAWWADDSVLQAIAANKRLDKNYAGLAAHTLPLDFQRYKTESKIDESQVGQL